MIIRQVQCTLNEADLPAFLEHARGVVSSHIGRVEGLVMLELAQRQTTGGQVMIIAQSHWRDFASMQAYLQANLYRPALWDPEEKWLSSSTVQHYEVVSREFAEDQMRAPVEEGSGG